MTDRVGEVWIGPITIGDLDRVIAIAASLKDAPQWSRGAYEAALDSEAQPRRIALAAHSAEVGLIGFAIAIVISPQAELESIAVATDAQKQGVGGRLFAELAVELKRMRVTEVQLEVRAANMRARSFYGALGFEQTGCRPRYYADPQEDAILLRVMLR